MKILSDTCCDHERQAYSFIVLPKGLIRQECRFVSERSYISNCAFIITGFDEGNLLQGGNVWRS